MLLRMILWPKATHQSIETKWIYSNVNVCATVMVDLQGECVWCPRSSKVGGLQGAAVFKCYYQLCKLDRW